MVTWQKPGWNKDQLETLFQPRQCIAEGVYLRENLIKVCSFELESCIENLYDGVGASPNNAELRVCPLALMPIIY